MTKKLNYSFTEHLSDSSKYSRHTIVFKPFKMINCGLILDFLDFAFLNSLMTQIILEETWKEDGRELSYFFRKYR